MGLPPVLVDTYQRYKKETDIFVQWIASTARSTGTVEDVFETKQQEVRMPAQGRFKGKARKDAKKADRYSKTTTKPYSIPLETFTRLADAIKTAQTAEVPRSMLLILRSVIRARKESAAWFLANQKNADDTTKTSNDSHQYFISTLEGVYDTLKQKQPQQKGEVTESPVNQFTNIFEYLELEELPESEPMIDRDFQPKPKLKSISQTYKLEPSNDSVSFAAYCFLKDATCIRLFIRKTWTEFKRGQISLQAATLTMNAGTCLIRKLNQEFCESFPQYDDHCKTIKLIWSLCFKGDVKETVDYETAESLLSYNENGQKLLPSTLMCVHTTEIITWYVFDPTQSRRRLSKDEIDLVEVLSFLALGTKPPEYSISSDLIAYALSTILEERRIPTWTVFAVQIFWDTRREIGQQTELGQKASTTIAHFLMNACDGYLKTEGLEQLDPCHGFIYGPITGYKERVGRFIHEDIMQDAFDQSLDEEQRKKYAFQLIFLHKNYPALCGLNVCSLRHEFHDRVTDLAGYHGMILVAAHIYNAAHQTGLLPWDIKWKDMDYVIEQQGEAWIFVGQRPIRGQEFWRHLYIARGHTIRTFAKDFGPQSTKKLRLKKGAYRCLRFLPRYVEVQVERKANGSAVSGRTRAATEAMAMISVLVTDHLGAGIASGKSPPTKTPSEQGARRSLSSVQTLTAFRDAIQKDEFAWNFNLMGLHVRCLKLIGRIQKYCLEMAPLLYPKSVFAAKSAMCEVVIVVLRELSGDRGFHGSMFPKVVEMLREVIEHGGDAEYQEASRLGLTESQQVSEPGFLELNPLEDVISFAAREMVDHVIIQGPDGECRALFE